MRSFCIICVLLLLSGCQSTPSDPAARAAATQRQAEIDAGVDRLIPEVNFDKTPLKKAIEQLQQMTDANIDPDWTVLEAAGIDNTVPITLHARNLPLSHVLELVADKASPTKGQLGWRASDRIISFSTIEAVEAQMDARVYDVHDLIEQDMKLRARLRAAYPLPIAPTTMPTMTSYDQSVKHLQEVLESLFPQGQMLWGEEPEHTTEFNGRLIIETTPQMHERITKILNDLRSESR